MYKYKSLQAGQLPHEHLSFLHNLLNFIITKVLKQADDDLSVYIDKRSLCGLSITRDKDLSMSHDQKAMLLPLNGEVPYFHQGVVFTAQIW